MNEHDATCTANTRDGNPCQRAAMANTDPPTCYDHTPDMAQARADAKVESGRIRTADSQASKKLAAQAVPAIGNDLSTPEGCGLELERVIRALSNGTMPTRVGAVLTRAIEARIKLHSIEISDRLDELEAQAKLAATAQAKPGGIIRRQGAGR